MKVILIDHTSDPVNKIGHSAAICYDAKTDPESNVKRAMHCKDKSHLMTMRFAYATFSIEGISRVCSHQLVRIAHAGILQESQRYVEQSNVGFITPPGVLSAEYAVRKAWGDALNAARLAYGIAIINGIKKEDARYILPQACETKVNLCLNFQGWQDFLKNRTSKTAQWEIREVALEIQRQLAEIAPGLF